MKKPMSQTRFGELFNPTASRSSVKKWESGKTLPNDARLKTLAFLGGTSIDYLLYGDFTESLGYGERIKNIRENVLNFTKEEFGKSFNPPVSEKEVSDWENELKLPPRDYLEYIALEGHLSVSELIHKERKFPSYYNFYLLKMLKTSSISLNFRLMIAASQIYSSEILMSYGFYKPKIDKPSII